jgi:diaminopimelate epimerase
MVEDVSKAEVAEIGPQIERDPLFPEGVNVEFAEVVDANRVRARVWERGVGETKASGTGATAAAYAARAAEGLGDMIVVELSGGELLVEFDEDGAWMVGPASIVFRGSL